MEILGTVIPGSTIEIGFNTFDSNDPSASVTATTLVNTDCHIHKDGGTTQRTSSAGETLSIDFDGVAGNHLLQIDLSDNTHAGFYAAGSRYRVRIEGATVDGGNINAWIGAFRIGYPGAVLDTTIAVYTSDDDFTLVAGSADDNAYDGFLLIGHAVDSAVQIQLGVIEDYDGPSRKVNLHAVNPGIFTMAATDNISIMLPTLMPTAMGSRLVVSSTGAVDVESIAGSGATADRMVDYFGSLTRDPNVASATASTIVFNELSTTDNQYIGMVVYVYGGTGAGQSRAIVSYTGATQTADISPDWGTTPDATSDVLVLPASVFVDLTATMKTSVQTAVDAAIDTAISELGVAAPTATPTLRTGLMLLYMALRNKLVVQTSGTDAIEIYNDAGTKIAAKTISDDDSDYTEDGMA